jgi:hypothetical protein
LYSLQPSGGCGEFNDRISFNYDSESQSDGIWIDATWCQGDVIKTHVFEAKVAANGNENITGLLQQTTNSWNGSTAPQFVNITFTIDATQGYTTQNSQSQVGTIYWNGQPLYTTDNSVPTGSTSSYLANFGGGSQIYIGGKTWAHAHRQDQTFFHDGLVSPQGIDLILYSGGMPVLDPRNILGSGVTFTYNEPYTDAWLDDTSTMIKLTPIGVGISSPTRDDTTYVV